jgi:hypothetical protein
LGVKTNTNGSKTAGAGTIVVAIRDLISEVLVMMQYRHAYEPILRWRALAISTVAIVAAVVVLDSIL